MERRLACFSRERTRRARCPALWRLTDGTHDGLGTEEIVDGVADPRGDLPRGESAPFLYLITPTTAGAHDGPPAVGQSAPPSQWIPRPATSARSWRTPPS